MAFDIPQQNEQVSNRRHMVGTEDIWARFILFLYVTSINPVSIELPWWIWWTISQRAAVMRSASICGAVEHIVDDIIGYAVQAANTLRLSQCLLWCHRCVIIINSVLSIVWASAWLRLQYLCEREKGIILVSYHNEGRYINILVKILEAWYDTPSKVTGSKENNSYGKTVIFISIPMIPWL